MFQRKKYSLKRIASWSDISLFESFRVVVGILLGPSLLPLFKEEIMMETLVPSVTVRNNDSIFTAGV